MLNFTNQLLRVPKFHLSVRFSQEMFLHELSSHLSQSHGILHNQAESLNIYLQVLVVLLDLFKSSEVFLALPELSFLPFELYFELSEFRLVELCLLVLQIFLNSQFLAIGHQLLPFALQLLDPFLVGLDVVPFFLNHPLQLILLLSPFGSLLVEQELPLFELLDLLTVRFAVAEALGQLLLEDEHSLGWLRELAVGLAVDIAFCEYFFLALLGHVGVGDLPLVVGVLFFGLFEDALIFISDLLGLHSQYQIEQNINMQSKKTHKVKVNALFHRLHINKNIKFQTRVMWKRHQNKGETRLVNHEHGYSTYDENISLQFNLVYDETKGTYEDKNTEVVAVISYEGRVKSGGYAKYNIAQVINQQLEGRLVTIPLTQCPDPNANVEVTFTYSLEEEGFSQVASVLNASSRDLNMSRIDFHDDKISLQMDRINTTISKLDELAHSIKSKEKSTLEKVPELTKRIQELEGENETLKANMKKVQEKLEAKQKEEMDRAKNDQKTITGLEKQLQKKSKEFKSQQLIEIEEEKKNLTEISKKDKQIKRYKALLADAEKEIEELRNEAFHQEGYIVSKEDAKVMKKNAKIEEELKQLQAENNGLKNDVAAMSFKLAKLFNAAYDYGDSKLLDYLQASIGLIQK